MKAPVDMGGEELRKAARQADGRVGYHVDRLRIADADFRTALDRSLELDEEMARRKNR